MSREAIDAERRARLTLERRLGELESRVRGMWVFPSTTQNPIYKQIRCGGGNTLATIDSVTYSGLKRAATLTSVPTAAPTAIGTSYSDGLTAAYDLGANPGASTGPLVWLSSASTITIKNPAGGADTTTINLYSFQMISGTPILSLGSYQVPCAAGGYATVYVPSVVG